MSADLIIWDEILTWYQNCTEMHGEGCSMWEEAAIGGFQWVWCPEISREWSDMCLREALGPVKGWALVIWAASCAGDAAVVVACLWGVVWTSDWLFVFWQICFVLRSYCNGFHDRAQRVWSTRGSLKLHSVQLQIADGDGGDGTMEHNQRESQSTHWSLGADPTWEESSQGEKTHSVDSVKKYLIPHIVGKSTKEMDEMLTSLHQSLNMS